MDAERRLETSELTGELLQREAQRNWTPAELLETVSTDRTPAGDRVEYTSTNYLLLGLVIEHVRGRPIAQVAARRRPGDREHREADLSAG